MQGPSQSKSAMERQQELHHEYCCIYPHSLDRISVINFSPELLSSMRTTIQLSWKKGIQSEGPHGCSHEFKLRGKPWQGDDSEALYSRRLVSVLMEFMLQKGWILTIASCISDHTEDKDCWFFKKMAPEPGASTCSITFNKTDKLRIIDGSPELTEVVRSTIQEHWHLGLQNYAMYCDVPEFKLCGNPWRSTGDAGLMANAFLLRLVGAVERAGWTVYTSVDVSAEDEFRGLDTWILRNK